MLSSSPASFARWRETASCSRDTLTAVTLAPALASAMANAPHPEPISATVMPGSRFELGDGVADLVGLRVL